jgi:GLPGLI family protein
MKTKRLIILVTFFSYVFLLHAQERMMLFKTVKPIDEGKLEAIYKYTIKDLFGEEKRSIDLILQIGKNCTACKELNSYRGDTLALSFGNKKQSVKELMKIPMHKYTAKLLKWQLFGNYPEKDKITMTDRIFTDHYQSTFTKEVPQWQLCQDTITIAGYLCHKATTHYKGRDWTAWYAEKVPIGKGPWMLEGLPGLIFKAEDTKGEHTFLLKGLRESSVPLLFGEHDFFTAKREKVLQMKMKSAKNITDYAGGRKGFPTTDINGKKLHPHVSFYNQLWLPE